MSFSFPSREVGQLETLARHGMAWHGTMTSHVTD